MNAVTPEEKQALLAHYTAEAARAVKQSSAVEVQWDSKLLGKRVDGAVDGEDEPAEHHFAWGSTGGDMWLSSLVYEGVEWIEHITKETQDVLLNEALAALARKA